MNDGLERGRGQELYLDFCAGVPRVPIVAPLLLGPVCLLSQERFEEPVRPLQPVLRRNVGRKQIK